MLRRRGGVDRVPESNEIRNAVGKLKIDQILASGAENVVTGCLSCQSTLGALAKIHGAKLKIRTLCQTVSDAIVVGEK